MRRKKINVGFFYDYYVTAAYCFDEKSSTMSIIQIF